MLGLERIKLIVPDEDRLTPEALADVFPRLVNSAETIFTAEVSQWGQFVAAEEEKEGEGTTQDPLNKLIASLNLTGAQVSAVQTIIAAASPPSDSTPFEPLAAGDAPPEAEPPAETLALAAEPEMPVEPIASAWDVPEAAPPPETLPEAETHPAEADAEAESENAEKQPGSFGR